MNRQTPHEKIWETYVKSWKAPLEERRGLLEAALSPECVYQDPLARTAGWDELLGYIADFQQRFPGCAFVTRRFMTHHGRSVAHWEMCGADGTALSDGIGCGEYDADGKLLRITGFFEVPA